MAKKQDMYNLIEDQDKENKNKTFEKLQQRITENSEEILQPNQNVLVKKFPLPKKYIFIISVSFLLILTTILLILLLPKNKIIDDFRYCTVNDYYIEDTGLSIQQYADENNLNIQTFNDEYSEFMFGQHYKLNTSKEVICLYEERIFSDNIISIYVTDRLTEIDILSNLTYTNHKQIKSVTVFYVSEFQNTYAKFEFKDYKYYLAVLENTDIDFILNAVTELLDSVE